MIKHTGYKSHTYKRVKSEKKERQKKEIRLGKMEEKRDRKESRE